MPAYRAFFASPFDHAFEWIRNAAATACRETNVEFRAVDETTLPGTPILQQIYMEIHQADFGIVVATGNNPNVLYELGLLHCQSKPTIIMTDQSPQNLPFDVRGLLSIRYDGAVKDEGDVAMAVKAALAGLIGLLAPMGREALRQGKFVPVNETAFKSAELHFNGIDFETLKETAAAKSGKSGCDTREIREYDCGNVKGWEIRARCKGGYRMTLIVDLNGTIRHVDIEAGT